MNIETFEMKINNIKISAEKGHQLYTLSVSIDEKEVWRYLSDADEAVARVYLATGRVMKITEMHDKKEAAANVMEMREQLFNLGESRWVVPKKP